MYVQRFDFFLNFTITFDSGCIDFESQAPIAYLVYNLYYYIYSSRCPLIRRRTSFQFLNFV